MRLGLGWILPIAFAGCGFRGLGTADGPSPLGTDLAGVDLFGVDLAVPSNGGTGPGPLGALPPGVCCGATNECAGRRCLQVGSGPYFCSRFCTSDIECNWYNPLFHCDTGSSLCVPVNTTYTCMDPSQYHYGATPTGGCCAAGVSTADQPCQGGRCIATGNGTNPFYCSQGCGPGESCPTGYSCFSRANGLIDDLRECWHAATISDPNATYTCQ